MLSCMTTRNQPTMSSFEEKPQGERPQGEGLPRRATEAPLPTGSAYGADIDDVR